jgi:hypothetical protein
MVGQRISKPTHSLGVTIAVPHSKFTPTPTMSPLEIAFHKGREAKRLGRPAENPHKDLLTPNDGALAAEWERGYSS